MNRIAKALDDLLEAQESLGWPKEFLRSQVALAFDTSKSCDVEVHDSTCELKSAVTQVAERRRTEEYVQHCIDKFYG